MFKKYLLIIKNFNLLEMQKVGCEHYQRNCAVQAPCCKIFYTCKLCHDDKYQGPKSQGCKVQRMAFEMVEKIKCLICETIQQPSDRCISCNVQFGQYCCLKCKLYENNAKKVNDIFHCDDCKMCRRGTRENTFHCFKCGYCMNIAQKNNHKCNENVGQSKCPICLQILKFSVKFYMPMNCGHLIHVQCLKGYRSINCPVCGMAMQKLSQDQNKNIDKLIQETKDKLPEEVKGKKVSIICNECLHKTMQADFHFYGVKCQKCGTYNTKLI